MAARSEKVEFKNSQGDSLAGRLEMPEEEPRAFGLFAHCFTCGKDIAAASRISRALGSRGLAVLRFDFTGLGSSEGDFANTNFSSNVGDLLAAADWLRDEYRAPAVLVGHSLGGAAVLSAAPRVPECRAVATIAAPADPAHVRRLLKSDLTEIERDGKAVVSIAGREFTIAKQFLDDLEAQTIEEGLRGLEPALLVLHSPLDKIVGIDNASRIYAAAKHPKSFVSLDTADHLLSRREDALWVADLLAVWAGRYTG